MTNPYGLEGAGAYCQNTEPAVYELRASRHGEYWSTLGSSANINRLESVQAFLEENGWTVEIRPEEDYY